ncbi:hypothetical protein PR003_g22375 [Phytophthora rubi]|uniref:Uncharacterized protein n=2 Tax=Phytophthora rubi TaxID=129364 RepID=A0A6A4D4V4_9STRA|nr:hypothetical protein PR001_g21741 [Phytophthora rubi]KAE9302063.1 hypothetical protein PR003_g22375 [Phytophthora rubi]
MSLESTPSGLMDQTSIPARAGPGAPWSSMALWLVLWWGPILLGKTPKLSPTLQAASRSLWMRCSLRLEADRQTLWLVELLGKPLPDNTALLRVASLPAAAMTNVAMIYSMYGHVDKLASSLQASVTSVPGVKASDFKVQEMLTQDSARAA